MRALLIVAVLVTVANASDLDVNRLEVDGVSNVRLQCVDTATSVRVQSPTWLKNEVVLSASNRITINNNDGTITFSPARPRDEGVYRCKLGDRESGDYRLKVRPHVSEEFRRRRYIFHGLGTNFTLPCGVTIGEISREDHHRVEWVLFMDPPSHNASYSRLFRYDSSQDGDTIFNNGSYRFDPSQNFSLQVTDFTVTSSSLQKHVVYFGCTVDTFGGQPYMSNTTTGVTFAFDSAMVLSPLPPLTVAHPGDNIMVTFQFRGFPDPQVRWMLGDDSLQKQRTKFRPHLQPLVASNNSTQAQLTIIGLDEEDTGVLTAKVRVCGSKATTSTMIVVIPHTHSITVHNGTSNMAPCGAQNLTLSFSLPAPIPVDSLKLKINFSEVLDPDSVTAVGRSTTQTYSTPSLFNTTQVQFSIAGNIPQEVKNFARFRMQVKLVVNGTEGRRWSEMSETIQTNCTLPEREVLQLRLQFTEGTCFSLSQDHGRLHEFAAAIQEKIHRNCTFQCEHLTVERPHLECSSDTLGTFRTNVSAYAVSAQLQRFYQWVEVGRVNINGTTLCRNECTSPPPVETGPNALLICVLGMAGIVVFLVLLIVVLIAVVVTKKRRNKDDPPEDMELSPVQIDRPPAPLPRPLATLTNEQYENMPLPLSRAGELVDEQLRHNENEYYTASENTGSTMYISEVASVPTARIPPPTTSTHPRSEPMTSTFYGRPISASPPPPSTHYTPPITPPTSPKMQFSSARANHTMQSPPPYTTAVTHSQNCHQRNTPPAFYPSTTLPGYVLHTPPASPTIATVFRTDPTHFIFPSPKRMTLPNTCNHDNQCVRCGLSLESGSDSRIARPGYISQDEALKPSHSSTDALTSNISDQQHRSLTCLMPAEEYLNGQHPPPSYPGLSKNRKRHGSLPPDGYRNDAREKLPGKRVSCRDGYTMHALDLRACDESCDDRATKRSQLPGQLRMNRGGYVLQVKEYCQPKTSSESKARKCAEMGEKEYTSLESVQTKTPNSQHNSSLTLPGGYLTHYPCDDGQSSKRKGSAGSEKDSQMHHIRSRNGYVQQAIPVTETVEHMSASRHGTDHSQPPQVVQLPDNVTEGDGELFRTQLWLLHQYSVTSEQDSTDPPS